MSKVFVGQKLFRIVLGSEGLQRMITLCPGATVLNESHYCEELSLSI
jgi:hypothetical protein